MRSGPLAQVFPVLRRVEGFVTPMQRLALDPLEIRSRAFSAMREMLGRLGEKRALVVLIDDMQWADADSLALLAEVLRPPEAPAMLLVATIRASVLSGEATAQAKVAILHDLASLPGDVRHMQLSRLTDDEACELAASLLQRAGGAPGEPGTAGGPHSAETIAREAQGHPFFIDALVRHAVLTGSGGADGLEEALWSSIASLEPAARRLMELVAVAPGPIAQEVLAAAADVAPEALGRHLARLRIGHLISVTGMRSLDTAEPYHDRVRAAVRAHLDAPTLAELHGALATALERTGSTDVEALALHWREAGHAEPAAVYAARAADASANALAFDQAAKLYEWAIELGRHELAERSALLEKLGDAYASAGRGRRAAEAYVEAARGAHVARALDLQRRGADQLIRAGHLDEGMAAMGRVLASIGIGMPRSTLSALVQYLAYRAFLRLRGLRFRTRDVSQILATEITRVDVCWSLAFGLGLADVVRGAAFQARNLVLALRIGEPYRIARALAIEAVSVSRGGGPSLRRAESLLEHSRVLATETREPYATAWVELASGTAYFLSGRYKQGVEHLERATSAFLEIPGALWELDSTLFFLLMCLTYLGRIGRVAREIPKAMRDARLRGDLYAAVNLRIGWANLAWLALDDADAALTQIDEAMAEWSQEGFHLEHYYELIARANALLYGGRAREAHADVVARWPSLRRSLLLSTVQAVRLQAWLLLGRCAVAAAEQDESRRATLLREAERAARRVERERIPSKTALATLLRAGIAGALSDTDRAATLLRAAAPAIDAADMALNAAAARRTLGKLLGGDEGRALVDQAEAWMRSESIKNPARMTAMLAPGFAKLG
jgi:tetratricopeptide (TPR) repeat protein